MAKKYNKKGKPGAEPNVNALKGYVQRLSSALVGRSQVLNQLGYQYGGDRNVYEALGYPTVLTFDDFNAKYQRQDIAKAVIDRPAKATWRGEIALVETDDEDETALEKAWIELESSLSLKSTFLRADKLSGIGTYGVLFLGFDDALTEGDQLNPVAPGQRKLLYVKPLSQGSAVVKEKDMNTASHRFGMPETYDVNITIGENYTKSVTVHHTRVVHLVRGKLESEIEGEPELKAIYNRLIDIEKLIGSSAEMFWRGARPGYHAEIHPDYQLTEDVTDDFEDQIDEYEHNLRRILYGQGMKMNPLAMQVADPLNHLDAQLQMISSETGIPKRILVGSERGELSSGQDRDEFHDLIETRREEFAEPGIIRPFVDRCIEYGVLPSPVDKYAIVWPDLRTPSDKDKAEVGKTRSLSLQAYASNPAASMVVPEQAFYKLFLGLDKDEVEMIEQMKEAALEDEADDLEPETTEDEPEQNSDFE